MTTISRRNLLATTSFIPLASCSLFNSTSVSAAVQQAASYAVSLANGVKQIATLLSPLSPGLATQFSNWAAVIQSAAAQIAAAPTTDSAASLITQIEDTVNEVLTVAQSIPMLPSEVQLILTALSVALPLIEAFLPSTTVAPVTAARGHFMAKAGNMTPAQALAILNRGR